MARHRGPREPLSITIDRLESKGVSGLDLQGRRWILKGAGIGAQVSAWPDRKGKARLVAVDALPEGALVPACPVFGTCGGCQLQQMPLAEQRVAKQALVMREVGDLQGVTVHPIQGAPAAYGYRNKLELSFGTHCFLPEAQKDDPDRVTRGDFLGFHPRGWFSRVVAVEQCPLASAAMNRAITLVARAGLGPAWDNDTHTGIWRHIVVREGSDGVLVTLVTATAADPEVVQQVADQLAALEGVVGVVWVVTDRLSEVAEGDLRAVLYGQPWLNMPVGSLSLRLPHDGFFQVNTPGAQVLFETIARALALPDAPQGTLLDLYCGVGAIGLFLAHRVARVVGVEINPASIACARENAQRCGVDGEWHAGTVEEILPGLRVPAPRWIVVDPPRVGLHPAAARFLAHQSAEVLIYVACNPGSLGRDRVILEAGGWRMTELWSVDLFPQTPHTEAVARFVRPSEVPTQEA